MKFFKILYQMNTKKLPLHKQLYLKDFIIGHSNYSFAIKYSPQSYNQWLSKDDIFRVFIDSTIKQLDISNYKYSEVLKGLENLQLRLVDCEFKNIEIGELLEGEEFALDFIIDILQSEEYELKKVIFRTNLQRMVSLRSNGVLEIDDNMTEAEIQDIKTIIDLLSFGSRVIV